jgi:hypothetical protein
LPLGRTVAVARWDLWAWPRAQAMTHAGRVSRTANRATHPEA